MELIGKDNVIRVKHSFNAGDLLTILPGLRSVSQETGKKVRIFQRLHLPAYFYDNQINATTDNEGNGVCMNEKLFYMLKPLIEAQDYIESFEIWEGQEIEFDYDLTRDMRSIPMPSGLIHSWGEVLFPQTSADLSRIWIKAPKLLAGYENMVIINRTQRYINPYITYYFLKDYQDRIIFSGTETERNHFCNQWNLEIEHLEIDDFYQLAQVINTCKFGIYNQSFNFHLADAMKTTRILELCGQFPNTFVTGANGFQFYRQQALEFYFNKLINK